MKSRIQSVVRIRDLQGDELPFVYSENLITSGSLSFTFDRVYPPASTNDTVYEGSVSAVVQTFLEGYSATVFAYGQSGSGKSFTMVERPDSVVNQSVRCLIGDKPCAYTLQVVEIYNEQVRDLLDPARTDLRIVQNAKTGQITVEGTRQEVFKTMESFASLSQQATRNRAVGQTDLNAHSSRSHLVFIIQPERGLNQLFLIDLAGSERAAKTNAQGQGLSEAGSINSSLLVLGRVISAIVAKKQFVPFRDSKLTRLIQNSLGGNANSLLIVCVSSQRRNLEETLHSLRFGVRCGRIINTLKQQTSSEPNQELQSLRQALEQKDAEMEDLRQINRELEEKYQQIRENNKRIVQELIRVTREKEAGVKKMVDDMVSATQDVQHSLLDKLQVSVLDGYPEEFGRRKRKVQFLDG